MGTLETHYNSSHFFFLSANILNYIQSVFQCTLGHYCFVSEKLTSTSSLLRLDV